MKKIPIEYVNLFTGLDGGQLDAIWKLSVEQSFRKNEMILFEDEADTRLFIIITCSCSVRLLRLSAERMTLSVMRNCLSR